MFPPPQSVCATPDKAMVKNNLQHGAALFIGLLMLTVMSLIAVSSMQSSTLQALMSGNMKDQVTAFEAAEAGIRAAEQFLDSRAFSLSDFDSDKSDGLLSNLYDNVWENIDWSTESIAGPTLNGVNSPPLFVIQYLGPILPQEDPVNLDNAYNEGTETIIAQYFRITARGTGSSDNSVVVLESVYGIAN